MLHGNTAEESTTEAAYFKKIQDDKKNDVQDIYSMLTRQRRQEHPATARAAAADEGHDRAHAGPEAAVPEGRLRPRLLQDGRDSVLPSAADAGNRQWAGPS